MNGAVKKFLQRVWIPVCFTVFAAPNFALADTITDFITIDDGRTRVFGGDVVDTTSESLTVAQSGGLIDNVILEFDVSSLAPTTPLTSASLSLVQDGPVSNVGLNSVPIEAFVYAGDGVVNIDDFDAVAPNVGNFSVPLTVTGGDILTFDFTDLAEFQSIINGGTGFLTIRLETNSFATLGFASLEDPVFASPTLRVESEAIPEPSSVGMLLLLGGCLVRRRRVA